MGAGDEADVVTARLSRRCFFCSTRVIKERSFSCVRRVSRGGLFLASIWLSRDAPFFCSMQSLGCYFLMSMWLLRIDVSFLSTLRGWT